MTLHYGIIFVAWAWGVYELSTRCWRSIQLETIEWRSENNLWSEVFCAANPNRKCFRIKCETDLISSRHTLACKCKVFHWGKKKKSEIEMLSTTNCMPIMRHALNESCFETRTNDKRNEVYCTKSYLWNSAQVVFIHRWTTHKILIVYSFGSNTNRTFVEMKNANRNRLRLLLVYALCTVAALLRCYRNY